MSKLAKGILIVFIIIVLGGICSIYYLFNHVLSSTPHTDRTKIKTEMMSYAESRYDNNLKFKKFITLTKRAGKVYMKIT